MISFDITLCLKISTREYWFFIQILRQYIASLCIHFSQKSWLHTTKCSFFQTNKKKIAFFFNFQLSEYENWARGISKIILYWPNYQPFTLPKNFWAHVWHSIISIFCDQVWSTSLTKVSNKSVLGTINPSKVSFSNSYVWSRLRSRSGLEPKH